MNAVKGEHLKGAHIFFAIIGVKMSFDEDEEKIAVKNSQGVPFSSTLKPAGSSAKYDYTPEKPSSKLAFTVFGQKGSAKTFTAFGITSGRREVISFDHKSVLIAENYYQGEDIVVYDGLKYFNESEEQVKRTATITMDYVLNLIMQMRNPESIIIDGYDRLAFIAQMHMRNIKNLEPYAPVGGGNLGYYWYVRNEILDRVFDTAYTKTKKSVVYTTYSKKDNIIVDGEIFKSVDVAKWTGNLLTQSDVVIKTNFERSKNGNEYLATIESAKTNKLISGKVYNLTNFKKLRDFPEWAALSGFENKNGVVNDKDRNKTSLV